MRLVLDLMRCASLSAACHRRKQLMRHKVQSINGWQEYPVFIFISSPNVDVIFTFPSRVGSGGVYELLPWVYIHDQLLRLLLIRSVLLLHKHKFEIFSRALGVKSRAVSHCNKQKWWSRTFKAWLDVCEYVPPGLLLIPLLAAFFWTP